MDRPSTPQGFGWRAGKIVRRLSRTPDPPRGQDVAGWAPSPQCLQHGGPRAATGGDRRPQRCQSPGAPSAARRRRAPTASPWPHRTPAARAPAPPRRPWCCRSTSAGADWPVACGCRPVYLRKWRQIRRNHTTSRLHRAQARAGVVPQQHARVPEARAGAGGQRLERHVLREFPQQSGQQLKVGPRGSGTHHRTPSSIDRQIRRNPLF